MSEPSNIPGYLDPNVDLMAESGSDGTISQSCSSSMKSSDVQIEQMSPDDLAEFFVNSLPQYHSVMTVLADFTRSYRMDGKAFLAISRDEIETLLEMQTPSVVDALTKLQGAATGQRQLKRRPKPRLSAVFSDLGDEILSARATDVDEGKQHGITALGGHDGPWVFSDEPMPLRDDGVLFSGITGVPAEEDLPVSPSDSALTPSSSRDVPIIFDTSPNMTISPSTLISPQAILNSADAEFLATLGGYTYPDMPKQKYEESQITDVAGLELIPIDETLSYDGPIETHDTMARTGSSVPEIESFERGKTKCLGTGVDRCVDVSLAETNYNGPLPGEIGPDRPRVSGGQEAHIMKANAEASQITPSTLSSHDQFSSTLKNDSNHEYLWLTLLVEASNNNDKPRQEQSLPFSPTSDDKYNSSLDRCEYYVLDNSPDSGAVGQHALVISEHGSQNPPNQSLLLSDIDEQIKRNSLSSYKSDRLANAAVFNDPPRSFDSSLLIPPSSHNPSDAQYVSNARPAASDPCYHCAPKGTDKSPVTISSPDIDAGGRTSQRPSPETLSTHVTHIVSDIVSSFDAAKIDATLPQIAVDAGIIGVRSTESMPHGLFGTADSQQMPPKLKVTNSSFYSPDTSSQLNIDQIAEVPSEKDNVAPMRRSFSASTGDISLELGSWIVVPRLSAEESHHTPPSDVYPAPVIPPIDALSYTSVEDGDFASRLAADTSFTSQIQALPEIPHVPLFYDGELELGFTTPTVRTRGPVKESAFSSHKWETDERPFFGQSHGSSSFFEQRKSKSGKGKGKERKDNTYQDKVVQTVTPPVDPYVEDPRIVQLSRKMNRLQKEVATLKVENENLKKQTLWSKLFSRQPVKEPSVRMTLDNEPDVMRIPPFPDLRFVTM